MQQRRAKLQIAETPDEPEPWVCGSTLKAGRYTFFYPPYIPHGQPVLLTGQKGVGKSSFLGFLASKAKKTLFMPGEESPEKVIVPRMNSYGVEQTRYGVLEPNPEWVFPACIEKFGRMLQRGGFDLVIVDPIGPYCKFNQQEDMNEQIRKMINDLRIMLTPLKAAFVFCRHPGKAKDNMVSGHAAWTQTPRVVIEMLRDFGPPKRLIIRTDKYQVGTDPNPRYYTLPVQPKQFPKWQIGEEIAEADVEAAKSEDDRMERQKTDEAIDFLKGVLAVGPMARSQVLALGKKEGLMDGTIRKAAEKIPVTKKRSGKGADHKTMWSLPKEQPDAPAPKRGGGKRGEQSRVAELGNLEKPGKKGKV